MTERNWEYFEDIVGQLLLPVSSEALAHQFDGIVTEILEILALADENRGEKPVPMYTVKGILKQLIYQLVSRYLYMDEEETLRDLLIHRIRSNGGRIMKDPEEYEDEELFYLGFRAITYKYAPIKGGELAKLSKQLFDAYRHGVPAEYLIGFIYQTGGVREGIKD